ncbi:MAG: hypothetical protein ABIO29_04015 [Sphingomicrobium sp.]
MIAVAVAFLLGAVAPSVSPSVTPERLPPVERCRGEPGFEQFHASLADAITRRDVAALRRLTASDIRSDFDGGDSWSDFVRAWGLDSNSAMSGLWKQMAGALALGCAPGGQGAMTFPGMFADIGEDIDRFELVVARPGSKLQSRADTRSPVIATLDWSSAILVEAEAPAGWRRVQMLHGGPLGWVRRDSLLSPLDYRLVSERRDGRWKLTAFVVGD